MNLSQHNKLSDQQTRAREQTAKNFSRAGGKIILYSAKKKIIIIHLKCN